MTSNALRLTLPLTLALATTAIACGDSDPHATGGAPSTGGPESGGGGSGGEIVGPGGSGGDGGTGAQGGTGGDGGSGGAAACLVCGNGFECADAADCLSGRCDASQDPPVCEACLEDADCAGAGDAWDCVDGICTASGPLPLGRACDADVDCGSGLCVDEVCCDVACGAALDDCMACSKAAGAQLDGVCGPVSSGAPCGDPAGTECDLADTCDGAGACGENLLAAGAACTSDGLFCNGDEVCDGAGACEAPGAACAAVEACEEDTDACRLNLWINEIHYDNADPDVGEGIELAGAAGIDLEGFFLGLVAADGAIVAGIGPLGGVLIDEAGGFGTMPIPLDGLPEGNWGYVLVDAGLAPVDFISHGGAIVGSSPEIAGLTSTDLGLVEDETTPAGSSLQLTGGPGASVSDFTWTSAPSSFGALNAGQSF